jgi:hypothetical protein
MKKSGTMTSPTKKIATVVSPQKKKKTAKSPLKVHALDVQQDKQPQHEEQPQQVKLLRLLMASDFCNPLKLLVFNVHMTCGPSGPTCMMSPDLTFQS